MAHRDRALSQDGPREDRSMSEFTVIWQRDYSDWPILDAATCEHEPTRVLTINQRLEPNKRGGGHHIELNGIFCMACGTDSAGRLTVAEAMRLCMDQHGWNRHVGDRLYDLAVAHKDELMQSPAIPLWCLYAFGMSGREIHEALNNGTLLHARMSDEIEQLASQVKAA
jgi:hypothetical protein